MTTNAEVKRRPVDLPPVRTSLELATGIASGDTPTDTSKPQKLQRRAPGTRFPVKPSLSGTDIPSADRISNSPNNSNPPPIPTKSHFRIGSGQANGRPRRPNVAVLQNGRGDPHRSSSETVLQASAAVRSKRMGMMRKEKMELQTVEEATANRIGHLRGVSHGSVLRSRSSNAVSPVNTQACPVSPENRSIKRDPYVQRLLSLPEHKTNNTYENDAIKGAEGILYALYQIHPHISGLIGVVKCRDLKLTSLELTYYNASSHVDRLDNALLQAREIKPADQESLRRAESAVQRDCASCVMAYLHVIMQLRESVSKIVADANVRYVRTLMLLLYGSMIEIQNAVKTFNVDIKVLPSPTTSIRRQSVIPARQGRSPNHTFQQSKQPSAKQSDNHLLPHQDHSRNSSTQYLTLRHVADMPPNQRSHQPYQASPSQHMYGHPSAASTASTSRRNNRISLHQSVNGNPPADHWLGSRSRSTTRSTNPMAWTNSSLTSSIANTPRSGESFQLPGVQASTQVNPLTGLTDSQEEILFEAIYMALSRAYETALHALPVARRQFAKYAEMAEEDRHPKEVRTMWRNLVWRCKACLDASESLHVRLTNMKVRDKPNQGRDDRSFWQMTKSFTQSFIDLVAEMKEAKSMRLLSQDLVVVLRPVQKASREAVRLIDSSPWACLTESGNQPLQYSSFVPNGYSNGHSSGNGTRGYHHGAAIYDHSFQNSLSSNPYSSFDASMHPAAQGTSPSSGPLPATPLSAALGPAAQATIPSAPSSVYGVSGSGGTGNYYRNGDPVSSTRLDTIGSTSSVNLQQMNGALVNGRR